MPDAAPALAPPHSADDRTSMWVDERIWGHRLWDSQTPWLLFLEFLNVAEAHLREHRLLQEDGEPRVLKYSPYQRLFLRNILFNNERMFQIADRFPDNGTAWTQWLKEMQEKAPGVESQDLARLRQKFPSFHKLASLLGMLRNSAVESETNRRWGSRFVFPFGPKALYEDLSIKGTSVSREYINFGRTGELLYLMLSRSAAVDTLRTHLATALTGSNPWNALLAVLQPADAELHLQKRGVDSYLPYASHPVFDRLAEDWIGIFELGLPGFDAFPYLVTLGAFHIALYELSVAAQWAGQARPVSFICEVIAPRKTLVRELSIKSFQRNGELTARAVDVFLRRVIDSDEWKTAAASGDGAFLQCRGILEREAHWPTNEADYQGCNDPATLAAELRRAAAVRHRQHVANVHRNYARDAGLVSKRSTNRLRYAPNDAFLKTLILATVPRRMEFKEFLTRLYDRYGLVFGEREARQVLDQDEFEESAFKANSERLEQRLTSLGMLRRLSDACAYVLNPFRGAQQ